MEFEITFDYLCPFARNTNEAVLNGLASGKDWQVTFRPFSLSQAHVEEGQPDVFEDGARSGVRALHWSLAVRDTDPDNFPAVHRALFAARHDHGLDIRQAEVVENAVSSAGVDAEPFRELVESGSPAKTLQVEHTEAVDRWRVFGVPTVIKDDVATFVRLMSRGDVEDFERALDLLSFSNLNEFKRTVIPR